MDCQHKHDGCVKCGEDAANRGITCCAECDTDCAARCTWALLMKTKSVLNSADAPREDKPTQLPDNIDLMTPPSTFDYSQIDAETAGYLRQKETIIGGYMHRTRFDVGQELKEAQERLAKHRYGCFGKWVASLGIKESTAYELINYHGLILRHAEKRELIEKVPYTLAREIAKPSADPELTQRVLDGDITSHKDYQELLRQKTKLEQELKARPTVAPADYEVVSKAAARVGIMEKRVATLEASEEKLAEMETAISSLQEKRSDLASQINASLALGPFIADTEELIKRLAPAKYSKPLSEIRTNEPMKENLLTLVGSVRAWCDEIDELLNNIKRVEVIDV
ncbi:hypothetical protein [Anaeroselena agilis]|uniref:Uncharacterized protein n=1 Tax=Anaeroselena agilis TaxID=3063788 RepID=A0ABU3NYL0_9FIRM|nr:hypothetical protein [Selenomonadales bacterium 4137-cl]